MNAYITKRLLLFLPTLILVSILVFVLIRIVPGDPALARLAGQGGQGNFTQQQLDNLRDRLGTDRHIVVQYGDWIWDMLRLDFGVSSFYDTPIVDDIKDKFPVTLELSFLALLMATVFAVPLGTISAVKQDTWGDYVARLIAIAGVALPTFWIGILIVLLLVRAFDWLPPLGYAKLWDDPWKNLQQLVFPAIALGLYNMAFVARVTRSSMLEVFREDFIRTARAKGLREQIVIARHALRNALLPIITISGWQFGRLIAGTVIIEQIFLVPGMGRFLIDSIARRDYTTVQAIIMVLTTVSLFINLLVDLVYGWLDPRIRYR